MSCKLGAPAITCSDQYDSLKQFESMLTTVNSEHMLTMLKASHLCSSPAFDPALDQHLTSGIRSCRLCTGGIPWKGTLHWRIPWKGISHGIHMNSHWFHNIIFNSNWKIVRKADVHIHPHSILCWILLNASAFYATHFIYIYHVIPQHGCKMLRLMWDAEWIFQ